jgi:polyhydroxybutyrate depolymerase
MLGFLLTSLFCLVLVVPAHAGLFDFLSNDRVEVVGQHDSARPDAKLYLPANDSLKHRPLVILLHGYSSTADRTSTYFNLKSEVNNRDFLILSPQGHSDLRDHPYWNATDFCCDLEKSAPDDVAYILGLIAEVRAKHKVDAKRIYLVGHSNGGFMANRLVCEAPTLFAGIVSLAGGNFKNPNDCAHPTATVSLLQIHGVDDPTILFGDVAGYAGGEETLRRRAETNGCLSTPIRKGEFDLVTAMPGPDTEIYEWPACGSRTEVQLWKIQPYIGKPGAPHKPAFTNQLAPRLLDWLFKQKRLN